MKRFGLRLLFHDRQDQRKQYFLKKAVIKKLKLRSPKSNKINTSKLLIKNSINKKTIVFFLIKIDQSKRPFNMIHIQIAEELIDKDQKILSFSKNSIKTKNFLKKI